ncbi:MAG: UDP-2,3-diacylglucosamine diphosphatase [Planctomycetota bacterium]
MTQRILGTRVFDAHDDERTRTILLSDLHAGPGAAPVLAHLRAVLERAAAGEPRRTRVLILGDLFDLYVAPAQLSAPGWSEVVSALRRATDAGVSCTVLHGNRDFLLGKAFAAATGARVVPGGLRFHVGGQSVLALHGDELCLRDVGYQRAKRVLRSWPVRLLARILPARAALRLGGRVRVRSQAVVTAHDPARTDLAAAGIDAAFRISGADVLVCGHVHRAARHAPGRGAGTLLVLPAFDEAGVHLEAGPRGLEPVAAGGEVVAAFPPRPIG